MHELFAKTYQIGSCALTPRLTVPTWKILDYFQEIATLHSHEIGYPIEYFKENEKGWMVLEWKIEIIRYPNWLESIKISTWAFFIKKILAGRNFVIDLQDGQTIISAVSSWVYMDTKKRRPITAPKDMMDKFYLNASKTELTNITFSELDEKEYTFLNEFSFLTKRSDLDNNLHVNNTNYMKWAEDSIPETIYNIYRITNLNIYYKKECIVGIKIYCRNYLHDNADYLIVKSVFCNESDEIVCEIYSLWKEFKRP